MKALVVGYGSIGKRHAGILSSMDSIDNVAVLSSQKGLPFETIRSLDEIFGLNPEYIVISSNTALHHKQLLFLEENLKGKKILMEKPLFDKFYDLKIRNNLVYVGYNLRFHPILWKIRSTINGRRVWNIQAFCGSYLPKWRTGRDYRETYSAKRNAGGGVLLDLSHELDYVQWLVGPIDIKYAVSEKVSDLEIDTDDLLLLSGNSGTNVHVQITLNYFTRRPIRQILIDGEGISIRADLVSNTLSIVEESGESDYSWPKFEVNDTLKAQHKAAVNDDISNLCTYEEGLKIMCMVDDVRSFSNR